MNIFFLDRDIHKAARFHCDQHIVKMPLETAQILCAVLHRYDLSAPYRPTHRNHPSVLWAGDSLQHYQWLRLFGLALSEEYTHRYGKLHKSGMVINGLPVAPPIPDIGWTDPPQVMPKACQQEDTVAAYRLFYHMEKARFPGKGPAIWSNRPRPEWMEKR